MDLPAKDKGLKDKGLRRAFIATHLGVASVGNPGNKP
jgi:hypothetical protein